MNPALLELADKLGVGVEYLIDAVASTAHGHLLAYAVQVVFLAFATVAYVKIAVPRWREWIDPDDIFAAGGGAIVAAVLFTGWLAAWAYIDTAIVQLTSPRGWAVEHILSALGGK